MGAGPSRSTAPAVRKPTPPDLLTDLGSGFEFETRLSSLQGDLTPTDRFFVRSHGPTPEIDVRTWRLRIVGTGVRAPVEVSYDELLAMPQVTVRRTIECAGNGRQFFADAYGRPAEGLPWRLGAIGTAEWTGVRLRDVLERAGIVGTARDVMPCGLDDPRSRRPMPMAKARADDTLLALAMNGDPLPPDHGHPARVVVSGWVGAASIKWVGRIEVSTQPLSSPWTTEDYVMPPGGKQVAEPPEPRPITAMPVVSLLDLDWPATVTAGRRTLRGRAYAGDRPVSEVAVRIDDGDWAPARLVGPSTAAAWTRFELPWDAEPGPHRIRLRATDDLGRTQPESVPWNDQGYCYNAVVSHPVTVVPAS